MLMKFQPITGTAFLLTLLVASATPAPDLATAISFGLLGGTISDTGTSVVICNVGAWPDRLSPRRSTTS